VKGAYWRISSIDIFAALESEWVDSVRISSTLALISNSSGTIWDVSRGPICSHIDCVEAIQFGDCGEEDEGTGIESED
jgi:hypothetical protein